MQITANIRPHGIAAQLRVREIESGRLHSLVLEQGTMAKILATCMRTTLQELDPTIAPRDEQVFSYDDTVYYTMEGPGVSSNTAQRRVHLLISNDLANGKVYITVSKIGGSQYSATVLTAEFTCEWWTEQLADLV